MAKKPTPASSEYPQLLRAKAATAPLDSTQRTEAAVNLPAVQNPKRERAPSLKTENQWKRELRQVYMGIKTGRIPPGRANAMANWLRLLMDVEMIASTGADVARIREEIMRLRMGGVADMEEASSAELYRETGR